MQISPPPFPPPTTVLMFTFETDVTFFFFLAVAKFLSNFDKGESAIYFFLPNQIGAQVEKKVYVVQASKPLKEEIETVTSLSVSKEEEENPLFSLQGFTTTVLCSYVIKNNLSSKFEQAGFVQHCTELFAQKPKKALECTISLDLLNAERVENNCML